LHFTCVQNVAWQTWQQGMAKTAKGCFKSMSSAIALCTVGAP